MGNYKMKTFITRWKLNFKQANTELKSQMTGQMRRAHSEGILKWDEDMCRTWGKPQWTLELSSHS